MKVFLITVLANFSVCFVLLAQQTGPTLFFNPSEIRVAVGDTFSFEVTANGLRDVSAASIAYAWDTTIISIDSVSDVNNSLHPTVPPAINDRFPGQIRYLWFDFDGGTFSVPDSTVLFTAHFTAVGTGDANFQLTDIPSAGFATEVILGQTGYNVTALNAGRPDFIRVEEIISNVLESTAVAIFTPGANPFRDQYTFELDASKSLQIFYALYSLDGKLINRWQEQCPAGQQQISLSGDQFGSLGSFYLQIHAEDYHTVLLLNRN